MRIATVIPYSPLKCRAPKAKCQNPAKHIATIQPDVNVLTYKSIHLCDGHLEKLRDAAKGDS